MSEKEKLLEALQQCSVSEYEEVKYVLLSVTRDRTNLHDLVQELCNIAEASHPMLIEMKR